MPTVVIAYDTFPDISIEQEIIAPTGAEIVHISGLESPESWDTASRADALMVTIQKVTAALIARLDHCILICRVGTGLDAIDISAATEKGIWVTNVPDYSIDEVSTHAIALLLNHARRLPHMFELVRSGAWANGSQDAPIIRLQEQTLGLIGFGRIGRAVWEKARGLGLKVLVYDPYVKADQFGAHSPQLVDLPTLLRASDYISLHMPLTDETRKIINAETLALMKPNAILINTARGGLIDEDALLEAITIGMIAGAALDVLTVEPPSSDHPLLLEKRVMMTPHVGWYSEQSKIDVRVKSAEDVVRVLKGGVPRAPVNEVKR